MGGVVSRRVGVFEYGECYNDKPHLQHGVLDVIYWYTKYVYVVRVAVLKY